MGTQAPSVLGRADDLAVLIYTASISFVHAGVDLFFVISGFIIFTVTQTERQGDRFREAGDFILKRVLRIYPLFWVTFFVTILPQNVVRWEDWRLWIHQLWLIDFPANHGVAWTLVLELRFYALVGLVLLLFRGHVKYGYAVLCMAIVAAYGFSAYGALPASHFTMNVMLEFVMGVGVAALVLRRSTDFAGSSALVFGIGWMLCSVVFLYSSAVADFVGTSFAGTHFAIKLEDFRVIGFGAPAALIVYGLASLELSKKFSIPHALARAGDASYSVYLWHPVILAVIAKQLSHGGLIGLAAFYGLSLLVIAILSWQSYRWIEMPFMRLARGIPWARTLQFSRV